MIKNYLITALRNMLRHKGFSVINIFGLAIGLAAFLLIGGVPALVRALRNPAPAALPANVIPFHRPAPAPRREPGYHRHFDQ